MEKEVRERDGKLTSNGETERDQMEDSRASSVGSTQGRRLSSFRRALPEEATGLPAPADQRSIVESIDGAGTYAYAVSKRWMHRWQRLIGLHRHTLTESSPSDVVQPVDGEVLTTKSLGPVDMDYESDDRNVFVDEGLWGRLIRWYGLSPRHQLDRKNRFFEDRKSFDVCVLNAFSGIVAHATKVVNRFEEIGYVEFQLRRIYGLSLKDTTEQETETTRLWISEKALVPRFQLLLNRNKMLNDYLDRDKSYILALEKRDSEAQFWPTGEPGTPKGDLGKYDEILHGGLLIQSSIFDDSRKEVETYLLGSVRDIIDRVGSAFAEDGEKQLRRQRQDLEKMEAELKVREGEISQRTKALDVRLKELTARRRQLESEKRNLQSRAQQLEETGKDIQMERDFMDRMLQSQNSRIVLDVGGKIFETSRTTMRKDPESLLATMFSESNGRLNPEEDGSYFIDRDGSQFHLILAFLRDETSVENLRLEGASLRRLLIEAQFYQLNQLVDHLKKLPKADNG